MRRMICTLIAVIVMLASNVAVGQSIEPSLNFAWEQVYPDEVLKLTWSPDSQHIAFIDTELRRIYIS
jgi:hypothetical protein